MRPQNSSDCSICNQDFKNFRERTPGPPFRCRLASLAGCYRPRNIYFLPHIQGGRSIPLCLFLFGTSEYGHVKRHSYCPTLRHATCPKNSSPAGLYAITTGPVVLVNIFQSFKQIQWLRDRTR